MLVVIAMDAVMLEHSVLQNVSLGVASPLKNGKFCFNYEDMLKYS
jgi:hypothetical protein